MADLNSLEALGEATGMVTEEASAPVHVQLSNVNEPPYFPSGSFVQEVVENSPIGAQATGTPAVADDDDVLLTSLCPFSANSDMSKG